jgi:mycothiol synthase
MNETQPITVRPARRSDRRAIGDFLDQDPAGPQAAETADTALPCGTDQLVLALRGEAVVGACRFVAGAGRCGAVFGPRMPVWDPGLAARLLRAAAATLRDRGGALLIQSLTDPEGAGPMARAMELAGFERLALLAYLRRDVRPADADLPLPPDLQWLYYRRLRHRKFAHAIALSYEDSLDCPRLAGVRSVDETISTHKHTGIFCPRSWRLAVLDGRPAGVCLLNNLHGRGEVVYLGVAPAARRQGVGRALLARALRDTAALGLPQAGLSVDVDNSPALHLYQSMGFAETRRRLAYFVPAESLASMNCL